MDYIAAMQTLDLATRLMLALGGEEKTIEQLDEIASLLVDNAPFMVREEMCNAYQMGRAA